jgi:hypothetical protein
VIEDKKADGSVKYKAAEATGLNFYKQQHPDEFKEN